MVKYDYIIAGGGLSGLSLAHRFIHDPFFAHKKILLIEREQKNQNDRTWCFWEKGIGHFEDIVYRKWDHAWFHSNFHSERYALHPYQYKMVRGIDLYKCCYDLIESAPNIEMRYASVSSINQMDDCIEVVTNNDIFYGEYVFSSIFSPDEYLKKGRHNLLQHFKGWVIETPTDQFDPTTATLMDFRMDQRHGTTFIYVMPFSERKALVEYTLFSKEVLLQDEYVLGLQQYISTQLNISEFTITEEEYGVIPMTDHGFNGRDGNIIYVGTAGGQTKASSGYTYQFVQKQCNQIVEKIKTTGSPVVVNSFMQKRFKWYDRVLLNVLYNRKVAGDLVFSLLFKRNNIKRLFSFLDNESKVHQELYLLNTLPKIPFMLSGLEEM